MERSTIYFVTADGLLLAVQLTVRELRKTEVHVDTAVAGVLASVAVVMCDVQGLELPSKIEATRT